MEDIEDGGCSLLPSSDRCFYTRKFRTCTYAACTLAALTYPLHYTVALDRGSEARYVRRQARGLGLGI